MKKILFNLCLGLLASSAFAATTIVAPGGVITWVIDENVQTGTYASGDPWVVVPVAGYVTITSITPASLVVTGREIGDPDGSPKSPPQYESSPSTLSGSMINPGYDPVLSPVGTSAKQGFDQGILGYRASLNVARPGGNDLSATNPLLVSAGSSLISTRSHSRSQVRPGLLEAAVLTVVASAPPAGSFRPPYTGTDKTPYWNISQIQYSLLQQIPTSAPNLPTISGIISGTGLNRPWLEINTSHDGRYYHPKYNQPDYGGDMAAITSKAALRLHHNDSDAVKEPLAIKLIQYGIDVYGAVKLGGNWDNNGGHNVGRKVALVYAGLLLNDSAILAYCNTAAYKKFQEDQQVFVVTQTDINRTPDENDDRRRDKYAQDSLGMPEWGEKHTGSPSRDGSNWSTYYRDINYRVTVPAALAIQLIAGGTTAWNNAAFFDYNDRAFEITRNGSFGSGTYTGPMWDSYRVSLGTTTRWNADLALTGATVPKAGDGDLLELQFSRPIVAGTNGPGAWTVTASGGAVSVISTTLGNYSLSLGLSRTIAPGETVTVSYTSNSGASGTIKGAVKGDDLPDFSNQTVQNKSP